MWFAGVAKEGLTKDRLSDPEDTLLTRQFIKEGTRKQRLSRVRKN